MPNWSEEGFNRIKEGGKKSGQIIKEKSLKLQEEYYKDPKLCLNCNEIIPYNKSSENKFCNRSCSATFNNKKKNKNLKNCLVCNSEISKFAKKYCSINCQKAYQYNQKLENWISGKEIPVSREFFRKYLKERDGYKCSFCGIFEWNNKSLTLEIDHIDGNSSNTTPNNLRFVCPNCHSQTSTYKGKNIGKGRHYRRIRYSSGQSY